MNDKSTESKSVQNLSENSFLSRLLKKLQRKWDWWIYCRATHSLRRIALEDPGLSYFMELNLRGWNEQLELPPQLRRSAELFHDAMHDHQHNS